MCPQLILCTVILITKEGGVRVRRDGTFKIGHVPTGRHEHYCYFLSTAANITSLAITMDSEYNYLFFSDLMTRSIYSIDLDAKDQLIDVLYTDEVSVHDMLVDETEK